MKTNHLINVVLAAASALLVSCAGNAPSAKFTKSIPAQSLVSAGDSVSVKVKPQAGVVMTNHEQERLQGAILAKINAKKAENAASRPAKKFNTVVNVTKYDKGNQFARAMLAGLGQAKIQSVVQLNEGSNNVGEFQLNKTFAWGGIYGGFTGMEEIESGFADGVADAVTKGK